MAIKDLILAIRVEVRSKRLRAALRRMEADLKNPAIVYRIAAAHMRQYVRRTFTLQGRGKPWKPLAAWTKLRTGRRKALIPLRRLIKSRADKRSGQVYFQRVSRKWDLDQFHTGFVSPPVRNKFMRIPLAKGGSIVITKKKASRIPARKIWPGRREVESEILPIFRQWVSDNARKNWR